MPSNSPERVVLENIDHPGKTTSADAQMYLAMKRAVLKVLPKKPPSLTVAELEGRVLPHLPQKLFPGGATAGWWTKAVRSVSRRYAGNRKAGQKPAFLAFAPPLLL